MILVPEFRPTVHVFIGPRDDPGKTGPETVGSIWIGHKVGGSTNDGRVKGSWTRIRARVRSVPRPTKGNRKVRWGLPLVATTVLEYFDLRVNRGRLVWEDLLKRTNLCPPSIRCREPEQIPTSPFPTQTRHTRLSTIGEGGRTSR